MTSIGHTLRSLFHVSRSTTTNDVEPVTARASRGPANEVVAAPVQKAEQSAATTVSKCPFHRLLGIRTTATAKLATAELSDAQRTDVVAKKATCPFIGAAVASGALPVQGDAERPLASVDAVVALGNTGGGDLGEVLKVFARGNHTMMPGSTEALDTLVPVGHLSLDFPGSQGAHPGHSGILMGDPSTPGTGRFSPADFARLTGRAVGGCIKRSDVARFIAENLVKDPGSKVFGHTVGRRLLSDVEGFVKHASFQTLTKVLGEDNLVGSAGEFGLLLAFLAQSPRSRVIDGEPAVSVDDVRAMFQEKRLPEGWADWKKTSHDWVASTAALTLEAGREYLRLTR